VSTVPGSESSEGWHRLHSLSPFVRAGRGVIALVVVLVPSLFTAGKTGSSLGELGVIVVVLVVGIVSWLVTRWRVEGQELRVETGLLKRQSLRYPLAQLQAIDVVRPGLARLFGLAELRLRMGGSTGDQARLAYLPERDAEQLRARLLLLAQGAGDVLPPRSPEDVLVTIPTGRLIASILISRPGLTAESLAAAIIAIAVAAPDVAGAVIGSGVAPALAIFTIVWRRFNQEYRLTVAETRDGLSLRGGLIALTAETIRPGRVQAVRMSEPLLWRLFGWCRLEVAVAGRQRRKGEGAEAGRSLRTVLPVGSRTLALELLDRIVAGVPEELSTPPTRARLKSPLRYHFLAWGFSSDCAVATSGRVRRVTTWVPLAKVQSLRRVEGPVQRRLRLASIHLDTAGRHVRAAIRDRDRGEADSALASLIQLSRRARDAAG